MCGFLCIGGNGCRELVDKSLDDLLLRGPDDRGIWSSPELALGHRRLAIIGLGQPGAQPMLSRSRESIIAFNGEIYNYLEIAEQLRADGREVDRQSDTAVLLEALETWGCDALPRLNGMFALAWYRPASRRLLLARDRWGKKPLFWGRIEAGGERRLVISSELRSFNRLPGGPPATDPLGVLRYLVYDGLPEGRTTYRGVLKLPPASWIELDPQGNELGHGSYWDVDPCPGRTGRDKITERVLAELSTALELRLRSDVPVGLFLSGGIDSSILAAVWRQARPTDPIRTFTVGFEEASYDERASARIVADSIGSVHHEILATGQDLEDELDWVWTHLSEPFADASIIPTSLLCRFARREVTVALGGDGADELQAGYDPFRAWRPARALEALLPRKLLHRGLKLLEHLLPTDPANMSLRFKVRHFAQGFEHPAEERIQAWMASFTLASAMQVLKPELLSEIDPEEVLEPTRRAFSSVRHRGACAAQIKTWARTYLEGSILTKIDRASMMHSLEVRAPFLDPVLVETLLGLPVDLVYKNGRGKQLLRRVATRLLPPEVLAKPKKGFGVPQATWLRTVLRERMEHAIETSRHTGWFDHTAIQTMWQAHLSGRADYRKSLWSFLFSFPFQS
jgi:asparagine synthase (glutamine-hydrolysing)